MKRVMIVAATVLLMAVLVAVPEQARAGGIIVFMADKTRDNVMELEVKISREKRTSHKLEMVSFSRGVKLKMVKDDRPPQGPCGGSGALRDRLPGMLVFGGEEDITEADIELSFENAAIYKIEFYWLDPTYHRSALIEVVTK